MAKREKQTSFRAPQCARAIPGIFLRRRPRGFNRRVASGAGLFLCERMAACCLICLSAQITAYQIFMDIHAAREVIMNDHAAFLAVLRVGTAVFPITPAIGFNHLYRLKPASFVFLRQLLHGRALQFRELLQKTPGEIFKSSISLQKEKDTVEENYERAA
jgi:hypothetical protein